MYTIPFNGWSCKQCLVDLKLCKSGQVYNDVSRTLWYFVVFLLLEKIIQIELQSTALGVGKATTEEHKVDKEILFSLVMAFPWLRTMCTTRAPRCGAKPLRATMPTPRTGMNVARTDHVWWVGGCDDVHIDFCLSEGPRKKLSKEDNISSNLIQKDRPEWYICREFSMPRNDPRTRARGWIRGNTKIAQS